jgi:hypothetical protein
LRRWSGPVAQQHHGHLDAPGEELIGQTTVCQRSGELQRADHQSEDGERVRSSALDVCRIEARRDVVDDPDHLVGEDISGVDRSPSDFVEQGGRRTAVRGLVAVFRG